MSWLYMANLFLPDLVRLRAWIWPSSGRFGGTAYTLGLIKVMANLSPPDLVRFRAWI